MLDRIKDIGWINKIEISFDYKLWIWTVIIERLYDNNYDFVLFFEYLMELIRSCFWSNK